MATKKASLSRKRPEPYDRRKVDFSKFKPDLPPSKLEALFKFPAGGLDPFAISFLTIDTLSVTKMVGLGRTNLTFIRPTIVQADTASPFAEFDRQLSPSRNPAVGAHFQPSGYGIANVSSYVIAIGIEAFGQCTFSLSGYAGSGTVSNTGTKSVNGKQSLTLGLHNVPPSQECWISVDQTAGRVWRFYFARIRFPFPVIMGS